MGASRREELIKASRPLSMKGSTEGGETEQGKMKTALLLAFVFMYVCLVLLAACCDFTLWDSW